MIKLYKGLTKSTRGSQHVLSYYALILIASFSSSIGLSHLWSVKKSGANIYIYIYIYMQVFYKLFDVFLGYVQNPVSG